MMKEVKEGHLRSLVLASRTTINSLVVKLLLFSYYQDLSNLVTIKLVDSGVLSDNEILANNLLHNTYGQ